MGASRQSFSLWMDWKFKNFNRFRKNLSILFYLKRDAWSERKMIIKDSFTTPYYKFIGCKITSHDCRPSLPLHFQVHLRLFPFEHFYLFAVFAK